MRSIVFSIIISSFVMASCSKYPDIDAQTEEQDIVLTEFDRDEDFSKYGTFSLSDTIFLVKDTVGEKEPIVRPLNKDAQDFILANIKTNLTNLGYTYIEDAPANSDTTFNVEISIVQITNVEIYRNIGWYPWWSPYPGYGYGYGYPYYYYSANVYDTGTLSMFFEDRISPSAGNELLVPWRATCNGLLENDKAYEESRLTNNLNQCFIQSPYLGK